MITMVQADMFKTGKRPMGWIILALSVMAVAAVMFVMRYIMPAELRPEPANLYTGMLMGPQFIWQSLGGLIMIVFGASLTGIEYGYDTWKNLLIRRPGRVAFIVSKWFNLALCVLLGVAALALWSLGLGLLTGLVAAGAAGVGPGGLLAGLGVYLFALIVSGSVALMGAVIGRSTVAGIIAGIVWLVFDGVVAQMPWFSEAVKGLLFNVNVNSLQAHVLGLPAPYTYSLTQSLLVAAAYLVAPVAIAAVVFRQRDMLGSS